MSPANRIRGVAGLLPVPFSALGLAGPCRPHVETQSDGAALFRPHADAMTHCPVAEETYRGVISAWIAAYGQTGVSITSIGLGRAVNYPWISSSLIRAALANPDWDRRRGRSRKHELNVFVAALLQEPRLLQRLSAPLAGSGYRVAAVSVEKVLVGRVNDVLAGKRDDAALVPYDAQVWLVLRPNP